MNDETSAPQGSQAGAENTSPATPPAPAAPAAFGFGTAKGSGLSRGKRQAPPTVPAASTEPTEAYIPTAIQLIEPERETFGSFGAKPGTQDTEDTRPETPSLSNAVEAPQGVEKENVAPAPAEPVEHATATEDSATSEASDDGQTDAPAELNILPTEPRQAQEQRWERGADTEHHRSDFRRDGSRRDGRHGDRGFNREGNRGDFRREDRRDDSRTEPRPQRQREDRPEPAAPAKQGGLLGWIKGLFSSKPETAPSSGESQHHDGERRGRRRRGRRGRGRGRGGDFQNRGPQHGSQGGERRFEGSHGSQEHQDHGGEGGGRRRHRRGRRGRGGNRHGGDHHHGGEEQGVRGGGHI